MAHLRLFYILVLRSRSSLFMAAPAVVLLRRKKESTVKVLYARIPAKDDGTVIRDVAVSMLLNGVRYAFRSTDSIKH